MTRLYVQYDWLLVEHMYRMYYYTHLAYVYTVHLARS